MIRKIGKVIAGIFFGCSLLVSVLVAYFSSPIFPGIIPPPYIPACAEHDSACLRWRQFRASHPFPYQTFAGAKLNSARAILIASEPPPDISHGMAIRLAKAAFSGLHPKIITEKWNIGIDGYVEDLVIEFDAPDLRGDDLLSIPDMRDRLALLETAWFGTDFGSDVDQVGTEKPVYKGPIVPDLKINPNELQAWMLDGSNTWSGIDTPDASARSWEQLKAQRASGAFRSSNNTLVLFALPKSTLDDPRALEALRAAFRRFAVSSDAIVGGVWNEDEIAFVGRARTHEFEAVPPIRFETFKLLATQKGPELAQSYQRTHVLAGKLSQQDLDWAPIYLSNELKDTEFGALLNITDQMLKSWSEHGDINYLDFSYPLIPKKFPFSKALTSIVKGSVQFNWNTEGQAAEVSNGGENYLTASRLGSLPVSYASPGSTPGAMNFDNMRTQDNIAWDYFAGLGDPNLGRVVQYSILYKILYAANEQNDSSKKSATVEPDKGAELLIGRTQQILNGLKAGTLQPLGNGSGSSPHAFDSIRAELTSLLQTYPDITIDRLAEFLGNPYDPDPAALGLNGDDANEMTTIQTFQQHLSEITPNVIDLEKISSEFRDANQRTVGGWIRTPSLVMSRDVRDVLMLAVGGHNIDAPSMKFVADKSVDNYSYDQATVTFHYNPDNPEGAAIASHADFVSKYFSQTRKFSLDDTEVRKALDIPVQIQSAAEALQITTPSELHTAERWRARLGEQQFASGAEFVQRLENIKIQTACCRIMAKDEEGVIYLTDANPSPPPIVRTTAYGDTISFADDLRRQGKKAGDIIAFDQSSEHLKAVMSTVTVDTTSGGRVNRLIALATQMFGSKYRSAQFVTTDYLDREGVLAIDDDSTKPLPDRVARIRDMTQRTTQGASLDELTLDQLQTLSGSINWNVRGDGAPSAIRIRLNSQSDSELDVVAGFSTDSSDDNQNALRSAVQRSLAAGARADLTNVGRLQLTIRNELRRLPTRLKRIQFIYKEGGTRVQVTMRTDVLDRAYG